MSVTTSGKNDSYSGDAESALAAGMAAAVLTLAFARVSGAHMNPAVTLAVTLIRQVSRVVPIELCNLLVSLCSIKQDLGYCSLFALTSTGVAASCGSVHVRPMWGSHRWHRPGQRH